MSLPSSILSYSSKLFNLGLGGEAKTGAGRVEHNVLALQEDVTEDGETNARVGLNATQTGGADTGRTVVDQGAGNNSSVPVDHNAEVGQRGRAGEDVSTSRLAVLSTADLRVVLADNGAGEEQQGGTGVSDTAEASAGAAAGLVAGDAEAPETLGAVHVGVGQGALVLGGVDESKVVDTRLLVLQSNGEEGLGQRALDRVKEGGLSARRHGVDAAESQTQETIVVDILLELGADGLGSLDSLAGGLDAANSDGVPVDITTGVAAITVGDGPGVATELGSTCAGVVDGVSSALGGRKLSREDPAIYGLA